jgi:signal transduction histidine kinase/CHASE3 domain sensor protein
VNLRQLNRILLQTLLLPIVALLFVAGVLGLQIRKAQKTVARMHEASDNISTATRVSALTVDEETAVRGYQLTGNEIFLQPYYVAQPALKDALQDLREGLLKQGSDTGLVNQFVQAHITWQVAFAEPLIQATANGTDTHDTGLNLRAKAQMDHIRAITDQIIDGQRVQRSQITDTWRHEVRETLQVLVGLALVIGLAIGVSARNRLHEVSHAFQSALDALRRNAQLTFDSEQRLRTMLTSIGEGIIVCDTQGKVELLNTVAEQLTGWSQAEALHQPVDTIFHLVDEATREDLATPSPAFPQLPHTGPPVATFSARPSPHPVLLRRDGAELPIEESEAPFTDRNGKLAGVVIVFRDISGQRRAQTALIATEKLAVAGRLAATLAHEIHNPLDAVVNLLYLLKNDPNPAETQQFLDMASKELDRVAQISRAMLGMYRESKTPVAIDVQPMLESILLLLARQVRHAQLEVRRNFTPNALVTGYPAELRQVFLNLLTNAAEASEPGHAIEVRTELRRAARATPHTPAHPPGVAISITDTGSGIGPAALPHLFQPFFTTKGENGTGLGLWVSQGIVEKHGGAITIDTHTDPHHHGTTVTVFLPRGDAPATTPSAS